MQRGSPGGWSNGNDTVCLPRFRDRNEHWIWMSIFGFNFNFWRFKFQKWSGNGGGESGGIRGLGGEKGRDTAFNQLSTWDTIKPSFPFRVLFAYGIKLFVLVFSNALSLRDVFLDCWSLKGKNGGYLFNNSVHNASVFFPWKPDHQLKSFKANRTHTEIPVFPLGRRGTWIGQGPSSGTDWGGTRGVYRAFRKQGVAAAQVARIWQFGWLVLILRVGRDGLGFVKSLDLGRRVELMVLQHPD